MSRSESIDNLATTTSIGLLAYTSADVAHHVFGHVAARLLLGGQVSLLTSQIVRCTVTGSAVDLAGPLASPTLGLAALFATRLARPSSPAIQLLLILVAAFNLFWFNLQLLYNAASRKDDWAWALHKVHVPSAGRYSLIVLGALGYFFTVRVIARCLKSYAIPQARASTICFTLWFAAGILVCVTAVFDHDQGRTLRGPIPQAIVLSIGLLFVPKRAYRLSEAGSGTAFVDFSPIWVSAALLASASAICLLGPGISN